MKNQMTFEQKVKSLTAKEMVETMIKGIEREWVKVNMNTFGEFKDGICSGDVATNTICEIMQKSFTGEEIDERTSRARAINVDSDFLFDFEYAIDDLSRGDIQNYNYYASEYLGMTLLPIPETQLPKLEIENYKENLKYYKQYALSLPNEKLV